MPYNFNKNFEELPEVLPLFPLSKVLLLPRAKLPLNLFENRYLHMLDYALANGRSIGMIQPTEKKKDTKSKKDPKLYSVGCAGYITAFSQTNDNRYEIILKGLCRFELKNELHSINGFRRAKVGWKSFRHDFDPPILKNKEKRSVFIENLKFYLEKMSINADWEAIEVSSDEDLVNSISMGCPFDVNEKQALLQAKSLDERVDILISLMKMSMSFSSVPGVSEKLS
ncbi:MAG: peptidase S16 [Rickettsiales bacterium]|nr:peptidase S16 [Rickettsiales bacterium]